MNNLNSILIEGTLARNPVLSYTPQRTPVCKFILASNRFYRENNHLEKEVSFFEVETCGELAEKFQKLGVKGRGIRVVGRLRQERCNDKDGNPSSKVIILAEHVEFMSEYNQKEEDIPDYEDIDKESITGQ